MHSTLPPTLNPPPPHVRKFESRLEQILLSHQSEPSASKLSPIEVMQSLQIAPIALDCPQQSLTPFYFPTRMSETEDKSWSMRISHPRLRTRYMCCNDSSLSLSQGSRLRLRQHGCTESTRRAMTHHAPHTESPLSKPAAEWYNEPHPAWSQTADLGLQQSPSSSSS